MVTTVKTWGSNLNHALGSTTDQVVQYRNAIYELKAAFLAAGWTVAWSTNGTSQALLTDYWTNAASIVVAASGTAHSMIILQAPAGWGSPASGAAYHLLLSAEDSSPSTNPDEMFFILSPQVFTTTSLTTKPTVATSVGAISQTARILDWTTAAEGRASYWYTTGTHQGDVFVFSKLLTSGSFTRSFAVVDPLYARGSNRALASWTPNQLTNWYSIPTFHGSAANASASNVAALVTPASGTSAWTSGADSSGQAGYMPIFATQNSTGQSARYYGYLVDVWSLTGGTSALWNYDDTGDADAVVLRGFNNIGLPVSSTAPALE
jgi:hypothetical protein